MNRYSFSASDVADDFFSANRIATSGAINHYIVDAFDDDSVLKTKCALDDLLERGPFFLFDLGGSVGRKEFCDDVSRKDLAVSDRCEKIVRARNPVVGCCAIEITVRQQFFGIQPKAIGFFLKQF